MRARPETAEQITVASRDEEELRAYLEDRLKQIYGSGTYVSDFYETSDGDLSISIGNAFPKDVSDSRHKDNVVKFISIDDVADLSANLDNGKYIIELESRSEVYEQFIDRKAELRDELDRAMARVTYQRIAKTAMVENQLNPIKQILRWTHLHQPSYDEVMKAQGNPEKTADYVQTLVNLGFISKEDGHLYPSDELNKYDLGDISTKEFNEHILGDVVRKGYKQLSGKLGLRVLRHFPKFSNGYYLDAVERRDPDLWLDPEAIWSNIREWYGKQNNLHEFILQDKLDTLTTMNILEKEDGYYSATDEVYDEFVRIATN